MKTHPMTGQKLEVVRKFAVCWEPIANVSDEPYVIVEVEAYIHKGHKDPIIPTFYLVQPLEIITRPDFLVEEISNDPIKKSKRPPKFTTYYTLEEARVEVANLIRWGLEFEVRKGRLASFSEEDVKAKCAEIKELLL